MTTVAANLVEMAGDTNIHGDGPTAQASKIFRAGHAIVGVAGSFGNGLKFVKWVQNGCPEKKKPEFGTKEDEAFDALMLLDGKLFWWTNDLIPIELHNRFFAIGAGASYAMTVMHCNESPEYAVRVASLYDNLTGGPVEVLRALND